MNNAFRPSANNRAFELHQARQRSPLAETAVRTTHLEADVSELLEAHGEADTRIERLEAEVCRLARERSELERRIAVLEERLSKSRDART